MSVIERSVLEVQSGFRSSQAALLMASLDDQHALLVRDLEGITPAELEWQQRAGMNTIGMLLAHIAIVEVFWTQVGPERKSCPTRLFYGCFCPSTSPDSPDGELSHGRAARTAKVPLRPECRYG